MSRPRILILENSPDVTGALKNILQYAGSLNAQFQFYFVFPKGSKAIKFTQSLGFECYEWKMYEISRRLQDVARYFPQLILNARKMSTLVKSLGIDGIVSNDFYNMIPAVYRLIGGQTPYLTFVRFVPSRFPSILRNGWIRIHLRFANQIIAVSQVVRHQLPASQKISIIYAEVPSDKVDVSSPQPGVILYPANFTQGKGHEKALRAFSRVSSQFPEWKLRFVGGDLGLEKNLRFRKSIVDGVGALGLTKRIEIVDFVEDMRTEYLRATFVLNFSESESFSMTCLESLFFGRPVIATRSGGPQEIIQHEQSGILVDHDDVPSMIGAMTKLMSDTSLVERMGRFGAADVRERFSPKKGTNLMKEAYQRLLRKD